MNHGGTLSWTWLRKSKANEMSNKKQKSAHESAPFGVCQCERCKARCRVAPDRNPQAKMLRKSAVPKGLCVNCAAHDWLRNTYPANMILAESQHGPRILMHVSVREQFAEIMQGQNADAKPDEINWNLMIENWELPWPHKVKGDPQNPYDDDYAAHRREQRAAEAHMTDEDRARRKAIDELPLVLTSFDQVNVLSPGLGDALKKALAQHHDDNHDPLSEDPPEQQPPEPPASQKELF